MIHRTPRYAGLLLAFVALLPFGAALGEQPFLTPSDWSLLRETSSGSAPYENLRFLTGLHRVPSSTAFDQAAAFVLEKAQAYGLKNAHAEQFPIDGETRYGLMRSYLGWQVTAASLWQTGNRSTLIADWSTDRIRLADYSHSADLESALIDVGAGVDEADYAGKEVRGKIVLADGVLWDGYKPSR